MFAKTSAATLTAAFLALTISGVAHAQTPTFGVQATAQTLGFTGTYADNPGPIAGGVSAAAASNPPGLQFNNGYGLVYAEAEAAADAAPGRLYSKGRGLADRITATAFPNSHPTGWSESRFYDVLTVESDTLPAGTDVTLVFQNAVELANPDPVGSGIYRGYVYTSLLVNSVSVYTQWNVADTTQPGVLQSPQLTVKTKVGARLRIDCKLRV